ncbi:uncharacterized protein [Gossypium hirsutum]|uniref:UDP-glucuronate decarboxylase n=2 Tax=Gossypium TaxID=3633 RepID=A0ABM3B8L1_GOSHI|nr:uncharacterized protein LOC107885934 isoform X2 [Gossypium hirsutum]
MAANSSNGEQQTPSKPPPLPSPLRFSKFFQLRLRFLFQPRPCPKLLLLLRRLLQIQKIFLVPMLHQIRLVKGLVKALISKKMIGKASLHNGLYILPTSPKIEISKSFTALGKVDTVMLWHFRLGHPSFQYLAKLFPALFINKRPNSFSCKVCSLAKHTKSSYFPSTYKPSYPFALIHSDIWGPSRVKNADNCKWFITFIDDHSRITWTYLLKDKSETASVFVQFYNMVLTQFGSKIQLFKSDNGSEFFARSLGDFFKEKGIVQISSCVGTPQQNGVAERKNRHLLEVTRSLLFTTNVPKYLWGEALLTATYLINRMPSKVLKFQTPQSIFLQHFPHFKPISSILPLKIFGCTVFIQNIAPNKSKLDPKSLKCVLVGYFSLKKGYKCYHPPSKRFFTTMDITFYEQDSYFTQAEIQGETWSDFQPQQSNMRILVTGGAGFIGSHLVDKLMENEKNEVIVVDNYFTGSKDNLRKWIGHPRFELIRHDVTEPLLVEVDQIYHLACPASPIFYKHNPVKTIKTNVIGTLNMLGLAKRVGARILLTSTSEVYGDPLIHPQPETYWGNVNPIGVRSCYDEGKRVAETLMFDYHRQHGIEIRIARIFNTYGPRMNIDDGRVVSNFIAQALRGEPLTVQKPGTQTRSFCFVSDMVDGLIRLMEGENTGPINIGNPGEFTMLELAEIVKELINPKVEIKMVENTPDDPRQRKPDITKAKELLGWEPKMKLRDGLPLMEEDFRLRLGVSKEK